MTLMHPLTTSFVARLRNQEEAAWFELWEIFGPIAAGQVLPRSAREEKG